jgi:hypothetical protein
MSTSSSTYATSSDTGSGFFGNISTTTLIIIILILSFLGFNIFVYLAKGTQDITNFFAPLLKNVFGIAITTTGQVVDVSAEGAKAVVRGTSNTLESGLTAVQNITPNKAYSSSKPQNVDVDKPMLSSPNNFLNSAQQKDHDYEADVAPSSVHGGKAGWCYIGEEKGYRTCAKVGAEDQCMSGDIFPSQEICVNPNLRP